MPGIDTMVYAGTLTMGIVAILAACSSDSSNDGESAKAAGEELVLSTTPVTLEPGDEKFLCWDLDIPAGESFPAGGVALEIPKSVHHYQLTVESGAAAATGNTPRDCGGDAMGGPPGDAGSRPPQGGTRPDDGTAAGGMRGFGRTLGIGGTGARGLDFPAGTAMMLEPGQHLVMQLHLLNTAQEAHAYPPVVAHVKRAPGDKAALAPVGVLLVNDPALDIAPRATGVKAGTTCKPSGALQNVFFVWPHMHVLGKDVAVKIDGRDVVSVPRWNFDDQKLYPTKEALAQGKGIEVRCTYDNPTEKRVAFGMSGNDEMCTAFVYYWPALAEDGLCEGDANDAGEQR